MLPVKEHVMKKPTHSIDINVQKVKPTFPGKEETAMTGTYLERS